ncbi:Sugar phosphate permease [Arachidicoccus rhizosphaerae]|jgi:MFS family permease|uniref:Sugar phosphate permease n=1 Tax=Arachidicoccus rhizosphaerae TaxID=551991 RepID=A0A1H3ZML7_9BACT|nr:MFS transporter [Arachidicoccus rhizosphaerae]SEA24494.1 Sugar phosphate permease [Arachidicoccus rhizosphaerae]
MLQQKKYYPWLLVALLWGVGLLNYLDRQMLSTMRPAIELDIHELQSATNFGFLMGIFLWIYGLMSPVAGAIADRINRKWLIVCSLLVWSAVTYGMGYAQTFHQLYYLRAVMGISEALYIPAALALIAEFHQKKTRSLAIGIHMTGLYLGSALGGFGATIAAAYTWHFTFHTFGLIGIGYAIILTLLLRESPDRFQIQEHQHLMEKPKIGKALSVLFSNIAFWVILMYFAVPSLPGWATKNWLPTLFAQHLNMPMSQAGPLSTMTIAISSFAGVLVGGFISDRWVQRHLRGRIYTSAIGLALTIPGLLFMGFGHSLAVLVSAGVCFGLGFGIFDANNMPILCQFVAPKYRATAYGIMNMVGVFFGAFITDLLGKSTDGGHLGRDFALLSVIVLVALAVQLLTLKPTVNDFR